MTNNEPPRDELARLSRERDAIELEVEIASSRLRAAGVGMDKPLVDAEGFPLPNLDLAAVRGDRHLVITRMNDHKALTTRVEELVKRLLEEGRSSRAAGGAPAEAAEAAAAAAEAAAAADAPAAAQGAPPPPARPARSGAAPPPPLLNRLVPFARVDDVSASSPAAEAGMVIGDRVVSFGAVTAPRRPSPSGSGAEAAPSSPAPLTRLPAEVAAALASGAGIDVVVLRAGGGSGAGGDGTGSGSGGSGGAAAAVREVTLRLIPREGWGGRGALGCHLRPL